MHAAARAGGYRGGKRLTGALPAEHHPNCTQQKAMVERLIRWLKRKGVTPDRSEPLQRASRLLSDWIPFPTTRLPYLALKLKSPAAAFALAA